MVRFETCCGKKNIFDLAIGGCVCKNFFISKFYLDGPIIDKITETTYESNSPPAYIHK
jgi:hypothetical protein